MWGIQRSRLSQSLPSGREAGPPSQSLPPERDCTGELGSRAILHIRGSQNLSVFTHVSALIVNRSSNVKRHDALVLIAILNPGEFFEKFPVPLHTPLKCAHLRGRPKSFRWFTTEEIHEWPCSFLLRVEHDRIFKQLITAYTVNSLVYPILNDKVLGRPRQLHLAKTFGEDFY